MTWSTFNPISVDTRFPRRAGESWTDWRAPSDLGSAVAGPWSWSTEQPERTSERLPRRFTSTSGARLHAPASVLQEMADAAQALGRDESDIWVEAAREWLARHIPQTSTGGPGRQEPIRRTLPAASARRSRLWRDIDHVLSSLREQTPTRESAPISVPA
jgi:hypothetical protein